MARKEVHAIYGLGGKAIGQGITALDATMDALSPFWDCSLWNHGWWEELGKGLVARQKRYNDKPTIIFIVHSYGCLRAQKISKNYLLPNGIKVAYIACIDATALPLGHSPMTVPFNVAKVDEFWATSGFPAGARQRKPDGSAGGRYVYAPNWPGVKTLTKVNAAHIACAKKEIVVNTIVRSVKEILRVDQ